MMILLTICFNSFWYKTASNVTYILAKTMTFIELKHLRDAGLPFLAILAILKPELLMPISSSSLDNKVLNSPDCTHRQDIDPSFLTVPCEVTVFKNFQQLRFCFILVQVSVETWVGYACINIPG